MDVNEMKSLCDRIKSNIEKVIVGKGDTVDNVLIALLSSGHMLLEDAPGMGKTMLAKALAKSLGCTFKRIQFTPDLLPSDLTGLNYFNQKEGEFRFREGAAFTNILLADEINRATPRTQSSLLECMEERQITVDGVTRKLEAPFFVIATQNPIEIQGTFPLPEAQLDRFMLKSCMGYPTTDENIEILKRFEMENPLDKITAVATQEEIIDAQNSLSKVHTSDDMLFYITKIAEETRRDPDVIYGASPRCAQALLKAAKARAVLSGRDYVTPDDVKAMAAPIMRHRLILKNTSLLSKNRQDDLISKILNIIAVPSESELGKR